MMSAPYYITQTGTTTTTTTLLRAPEVRRS
jgi:hypothetical protein